MSLDSGVSEVTPSLKSWMTNVFVFNSRHVDYLVTPPLKVTLMT